MDKVSQIHCDWCNGKLDWDGVVRALRLGGAKALGTKCLQVLRVDGFHEAANTLQRRIDPLQIVAEMEKR